MAIRLNNTLSPMSLPLTAGSEPSVVVQWPEIDCQLGIAVDLYPQVHLQRRRSLCPSRFDALGLPSLVGVEAAIELLLPISKPVQQSGRQTQLGQWHSPERKLSWIIGREPEHRQFIGHIFNLRSPGIPFHRERGACINDW